MTGLHMHPAECHSSASHGLHSWQATLYSSGLHPIWLDMMAEQRLHLQDKL